jgi:hypothetical protein|tara:strand:- start:4451 stop:4798 length:348 start_codon:yes stop_codon:yes gene_type:complete
MDLSELCKHDNGTEIVGESIEAKYGMKPYSGDYLTFQFPKNYKKKHHTVIEFCFKSQKTDLFDKYSELGDDNPNWILKTKVCISHIFMSQPSFVYSLMVSIPNEEVKEILKNAFK